MKNALLVIDVQEALFNTSPPPFHAQAIIDNINILIDNAREKSVPIIFIQHEDNDELRYGSKGWQLCPQLHREESDIYVRKTTLDSFLNTVLLERLNQLNIEQCIICGYASEFCVDTTTRRAAALKFPVILVADAHTTHDKPQLSALNIIKHHTATLTSMTSFGVKIKGMMTQDIDFSQ